MYATLVCVIQQGLVHDRRLQAFKEKTLNLPFMSPDLAIVAEQYLSELTPSQRGADGMRSTPGGWNGMTFASLSEDSLAGMDPLSAEYAMLDSERRLRQHLAGDIQIQTGDQF